MSKKKRGKKFGWFAVIIVLIAVIAVVKLPYRQEIAEEPVPEYTEDDAKSVIAAFAQKNSIDEASWPEELVELLDKNPDTKEFVLNYPLKKDKKYEINLSEHINTGSVPMLYQWDERWGYQEYNENIMGLSGCGPTCLSMVSLYILKNPDLTPLYIADFSEKNGYCLPNNGSLWTLISEGSKRLGLSVSELGLDENLIRTNLEAGNPIICNMGPGDFSEYGHYIVMADWKDGKIKINDPNSIVRSLKLWDYEEVKNQIRNMWVFKRGC